MQYMVALPSRTFLFLKLALSAPFVLLQRLIFPIFPIRVINMGTGSIGDFINLVENYLVLKDKEKNFSLDLFFCHETAGICNKVLFEKFLGTGRFLFIWQGFSYIYKLNCRLPNPSKYTVFPVYKKWDNMDCKPYIELSNEEIALGESYLKKFGLNIQEPLICFHNRDNAFKNDNNLKICYGIDQSYRNGDIKNYLSALKFLQSSGFAIFRMGKICQEKSELNCVNEPDSDRTDLIDLFLMFHCKFFIGSNSGISYVPGLKRKPVLLVNYLPLTNVSVHLFARGSHFLPKKFFHIKKKRFLNFKEISNIHFNNADETATLKNIHEFGEIRIEENSPEEILEATKEMIQRVFNRYEESEEMRDLQIRFWLLSVELEEAIKIVDRCNYRVSNFFLSKSRSDLGFSD